MANSDSRAADSITTLLDEARALVDTAPAVALEKLRAAADSDPDHPEALRLAGAALRRLGEWPRAAKADRQVVAALSRHPRLVEARRAIDEEQPALAERLLKAHLTERRDDPAALSILAGLAEKLDRLKDAEALLRHAGRQLPSFPEVRFDLAVICYRTGRYDEALGHLEVLLTGEPDEVRYLNLRASIFATLGRFDEAVAIYEDITSRAPDQGRLWIQYGNQLAAVGREEDSVAAYRRAIAVDPGYGPVWWSLANLKTVGFERSDAELMAKQLERPDLGPNDRTHIHFALAKAFEDLDDAAEAFRHYSAGNRTRCESIKYRPETVSELVDHSVATFTPDFFAARAGWGAGERGPIFVLGMPRAGSTLVEQILASHSDIEGTAELAHIRSIAVDLKAKPGGYPACLASLDAAECAALGERYLNGTRSVRRTDRPLFIDKNPNNWMHIGLIRLILPEARIIDVRRHPLDCCVSNFRQLFARGQGFSYSLENMGRYYADYVRLMRHFDSVLPGRIHRLVYEDLIEDLEPQVRAMLAYLGVEFDPACLRFHETERAVRTPSTLQVRRPVNRSGIGGWRRYEPWLDPLKAALGPVLDDYGG